MFGCVIHISESNMFFLLFLLFLFWLGPVVIP